MKFLLSLCLNLLLLVSLSGICLPSLATENPQHCPDYLIEIDEADQAETEAIELPECMICKKEISIPSEPCPSDPITSEKHSCGSQEMHLSCLIGQLKKDSSGLSCPECHSKICFCCQRLLEDNDKSTANTLSHLIQDEQCPLKAIHAFSADDVRSWLQSHALSISPSGVFAPSRRQVKFDDAFIITCGILSLVGTSTIIIIHTT
ncbi:MAG: hypothetical protein H6618_02490 [Deltaproteobacteria bacterium]|nr:hypothetical protein [Deltaproteobacteria bacterium]